MSQSILVDHLTLDLEEDIQFFLCRRIVGWHFTVEDRLLLLLLLLDFVLDFFLFFLGRRLSLHLGLLLLLLCLRSLILCRGLLLLLLLLFCRLNLRFRLFLWHLYVLHIVLEQKDIFKLNKTVVVELDSDFRLEIRMFWLWSRNLDLF
jgi:hypothetical protein